MVSFQIMYHSVHNPMLIGNKNDAQKYLSVLTILRVYAFLLATHLCSFAVFMIVKECVRIEKMLRCRKMKTNRIRNL